MNILTPLGYDWGNARTCTFFWPTGQPLGTVKSVQVTGDLLTFSSVDSNMSPSPPRPYRWQSALWSSAWRSSQHIGINEGLGSDGGSGSEGQWPEGLDQGWLVVEVQGKGLRVRAWRIRISRARSGALDLEVLGSILED